MRREVPERKSGHRTRLDRTAKRAWLYTDQNLPIVRCGWFGAYGGGIRQVVQEADLDLEVRGGWRSPHEVGKEEGVWTYHVAKRESQPLCILGVDLYCLEASFCGICCIEVGKRGGGGHACPADVCLGLVFDILRV